MPSDDESASRTEKAQTLRVPDEPVDCDRCGDEIHALMPATSIKFMGNVDSGTLTVCPDCVEGIIEWFNSGEAIANAE